MGEPRPGAPKGVPGAILISLGCNLGALLLTHVALRLAGKGEALDYGPRSSTHAELLARIAWRTQDIAPAPAERRTEGGTDGGSALRYAPCEREPLTHHGWCLLLVVVLAWLALPFYRTAGETDATAFGAPAWAVTSVAVLLGVHLLLIYCVWQNWRGENALLRAPKEAEMGDVAIVQKA